MNEGDAIRIIYRAQTPVVSERRETYQGDASIQGIVFGVLFTMGIVFALVSLFGLVLKLKLKRDLQAPTYGIFTPPK